MIDVTSYSTCSKKEDIIYMSFFGFLRILSSVMCENNFVRDTEIVRAV